MNSPIGQIRRRIFTLGGSNDEHCPLAADAPLKF